MVPRLPPELTDRIIDFVSGLFWRHRMHALYSCALTCRAWLPASLFHIYGDEVYLRTHKSFEALVRASRILHISTSLRSVRALRLIDAQKPEHAWVHRFVLTLGHTFAAIEALTIGEIKWDQVIMHSAIPSVGLAHFRCVTKLHLRWCSFRSFRQVQCIICAFPQLRYLTVSYSGAPSPPTIVPILRLPPLTHLRLILYPHERMPYYRWFASMSFQLSLQSVILSVDMQTLQDLCVMLQNHARRLEEVMLYFESEIPPSSLYALNVHQCTALRKLVLVEMVDVSLAGVLDLVSPESRIRTLAMEFAPGTTEPEWERASRMLEEERFCALQQLSLRINHKVLYQDEEAQQRIDATFDPLRRRGVSAGVEFYDARRRMKTERLDGLRLEILATGGWTEYRRGFV